jgi:hypothetical protein
MFNRLKDKLVKVWDNRFLFGICLALGDVTFNRFSNNEMLLGGHIGIVMSPGTGHWPWYVFEVAYSTGPRGSWHIGVLGFTIGMVIVNDYDESTGEIVGPDKKKYYYFFKGINHQNKQLEEII